MLMEPIYNLPKIQFVGGESLHLRFNLRTTNGEEYVTNAYDVNFAISRWGDNGATPVISKDAVISLNAAGTSSVVDIELDSSDTLLLHGRYKYQITILGDSGIAVIPGRGICEIVRNINPGYVNVT